MPEVSVIVPVYGVEKYIDKCIKSIIDQSFKAWELILIDDGSPDQSGAICDKYAEKDQRIKVIHSENNGVSHARNIGLDNAKGRYVVFVDSDDWVNPSYLQNLIERSSADDTVVYGNVINDYSDQRNSVVSFSYEDGQNINLDNDVDLIVKYRLPENGFPIAKLFSREIIEQYKLRFDETLSYHEDHLFVLNYLLYVKSVRLSDSPDYHYEHRNGVSSLSKRRHPADKLINASEKLLTAIEQGNNRWKIVDKRYLARLYTFLGLNQLMLALKNATAENICSVGIAMRRYKSLFKNYYTPNHRVYRVIPIFISLYGEYLMKPILQWKEKRS
ncbi:MULTISPECIES: glycosyltransferase family 2 protein [Bacteroidales]|uniref:glycosyltransferase family 2 protein n=1 Tax=Bacteroidales TaxID=171549 RepID=UPI002586AAEA|nr:MULTISPECIES: glycosyltransferase family 2 protein [Bacteroidales]